MTTSLFLIILFMVALLPANIIKETKATAAAGSAWQSVVVPNDDDGGSRLHSSSLHHSPITDFGHRLSTGSHRRRIRSNERNQQNRRIARAPPTINQEYLPGELLPQFPPPPPLAAIPLLPKPFAEKQNIQHNGTTPLCGGYYRVAAGTIQTPNFPHRFKTPIECIWIIDASEIHSHAEPGANVSIVVYLTQLYVLGGLKFTEYMYYSDDYKVPSHRLFQLTEDDATKVAWIQFTSQYLEIRFEMQTLDGTHLRALDRLLDVYGFNITYEIDTVVKPYQCNALQCRFLGHCWANADYTAYNCSCFPGFSGSDCGHGPLCDDPHTNFCQNGGTCKHIGDAAITCHCPSGFKGNKCELSEINEITKGCTGNSSIDCHKQCDFQTGSSTIKLRKNISSERIAARTGKTRFEVTIRLGTNLTSFYRSVDAEKKATEHLPSILERHMGRILRNFNITRINDLELISNSSDRLDITFHFFGVKSDSTRIREAITRMVERGRIGNITLVSNFHLFDENPPLKLLDVTINKKSPIREKSEFVLSCSAQGSSRINFQWYKDGAIVNTSKATREIWTTVLPPENEHFYTAILGITKANLMDEGVYTCKVVDWSVEQCRSIHVHIQTPPRLRVDPASVTLHRGDSLRVRCLSPGNDIKRYGQLGYSWTRNGVLFQSDPQTVMWEDLYPDGSILKINNIQKSAEYSCVVSNSVSPVSKSVYVTVIDRNMVELCHAEMNNGVQWPTTAPGAAIVADCPKKYQGYSRRVCEKRDVGNTTWLQPDFSQCVADQLLKTYNQFQALTSGYQKTNVSAILKACLQYTTNRHENFLLGEAGFLLDMLQNVGSYLEIKCTQLEREMAAEIVLHILDKVMLNFRSLNSQKHIKKLQFLTQWAALSRETIAASQLATSTSSSSYSSLSSVATLHSASSSSSSSSTPALSAPNNNRTRGSSTAGSSSSSRSSSYTSASGAENMLSGALAETEGASVILDEETLSLDRLSSLRTYMTAVKTLPFNLRIYGDDLFSDQLYMDITLSKLLLSIMANSTIFASVISYKNLKSFLPKTYFSRGSDSKDTDYILASRVVQTWLFQSNRSNDNMREPLDLPLDVGHVEIIFQHEPRDINSDWIPVCGHDYKATFESTWRTEPCITKNLMANITRCICPLSGTFVVLLAKKTENVNIIRPSECPIFVIIGCGCCFLQSCTAFIVLLPIWYHKKCCVTFLKMQFCTSTSSIMVIFLLGFLKMLPQDLQGIISSTLASLMLLGISTIIAIALVVHSQLIPRKLQVTNNLSSGLRGAIGISWLLPFLFAICSPLISNIIGKWPKHWWLDVDSSGFVLFVVVEMLLIVPFGLLLFILIRKLLWLLRKHGQKGTMLWERIGLLYRSGMILFLKLSTDSLFIAYLNTKENTILSYILGISCTLLGFSVLFCFVIKAEQSLRSAAVPSPSSKTSANLQGNYCSGSINSPLSFYTNYEKEKDNESGASLQHSPPDASVTQLPLTTISTAPSRCQMVAGLRPAKTVETFLGMVVVRPGEDGSGGGGGGCLPLGGYSDKKTKLHEVEQYHHTLTNVAKRDPSDIKGGDDVSNKSLSSTDSNIKSRCCNILLGVSGGGGGNHSGGSGNGCKTENSENETFSWQRRPHHEVTTWDLYNAYTPTAAAAKNKGHSHQYHHQHQHGMSSLHAEQIKDCTRPESPDFVAVKTLDILQGVSPDSIIGIRTSMSAATTTTMPSAKPNDIQHFKPFVENLPTMTTSLTKTQAAPQSQKHVTIAEIQKLTPHHPFDHMPAVGTSISPPCSSSSAALASSSSTTDGSYMSRQTSTLHPPIIMITSSSMDHAERTRDTGVLADRLQQNRTDNMKESFTSAETVDVSAENKALGVVDMDASSNGMLDRISHDLDYLLNRTNDVPPPPSTLIHVGRPSTTLPSSSTTTTTSTPPSQAPPPPPPTNLTSTSNECDSCAVSVESDLGVHEVISIPPPPLPPSGSIPITISCSTLRTRISVLHEVIMEDDAEQEQE